MNNPFGNKENRPPRHKPGRTSAKHARFLAHATYLEEAGPPRAISILVWLIAAMIAAAIIWSVSARIEESAAASGEVMPSGAVRQVQHLEGGIVDEILVSEGEIVDKGQLLARLDEGSAQSELEQIRARFASLTLKAERLKAFAARRDPDFSGVDHQRFSALIADQLSILQLQNDARTSQRKVIEAQINDRKTEIETLRRQRTLLQEDIKLIGEELEMRSQLLKKGLMSRVVYLDVQRAANRARGELREIEGNILRARQAITEAQSRIVEQETRLQNEALAEMGGVTAEMAELYEKRQRAEQRVGRLEITSPARGAVQNLQIRTLGGVIAPGAIITDIVPVEDELIVEARIDDEDIGHVRLGQNALVKVTAFDFAKFGGVEGKLTKISATTFMDEEGNPYYKGVISLEKNYVGTDPARNKILPGMTILADISTGSRTVFEYMLAPVYRAFDGAFRER